MDTGEILRRYCEQVRGQGLTAGMVKDVSNEQTQLILSALFFADVESGGFAKFVYNANGVYLPEMIEVLSILKASNTGVYLDKVVQFCLEQHEEYLVFLEGDFSDTPFKCQLDVLSEEYRASDSLFESEAEESIQKLARTVDLH